MDLADKWDRQAAGNGSDRANALSRCADELRALASRAGGWRTIESAPMDVDILVFCDDGFGQYYRVVFSSVTNDWSDGIDLYQPTHWHPIPEPPATPLPPMGE